MRRDDNRRGGRYLLCCTIPIVLAQFAINSVCYLNWRHYGVWEITELKSPKLQDAYGSLCRVAPDHFDPIVPITHATREKIYAASPAFAELRRSLDGPSGRVWAALGASEFPNLNGEIAGVWFIFALCDAVAEAGHSHSALEARDFYAKLAGEVNATCDSGLLEALPRRSSLGPPWNAQYVPLLARSALHGVTAVATFESLDIDVDPSVGDAAAIVDFSNFIHTTATPVDPGSGGPLSVSEDDSPSIQAWRLVGVVYQFLLPWLAVLALIVFAVQLLRVPFGYRSPLLILDLACAGLVITRVGILSYLDVAFFPAINSRYLAPAYPMQLLFVAIAMTEFVREIVMTRSRRR